MTPHLIPPRQLVAAAPAMMGEASIMAPRALDLRLEVPTSIEDPEATIKLIHAMTATLHDRNQKVNQPLPRNLRYHINVWPHQKQ